MKKFYTFLLVHQAAQNQRCTTKNENSYTFMVAKKIPTKCCRNVKL